MYDRDILIERLTSILEALERIPPRLAGIECHSDFTDTPEGCNRMDAVCMVLLATGEELKTIDKKTKGTLLSRYPEVDWRGVMGTRDFLAHGYFRVDAVELYGICKNDVPVLIQTVRRMIEELG